MSGDEQFWSQVQLALDERRDPLVDDAVLQGIVEDPKRLQQLLGMLAQLEQLSRVTQRRPQLWPVRRIAVAAAVLIAVGGGLVWFMQRGDIAPQPRPSLQSRVISVEWEFTTETPTSRRSVVITDRGLTARAEYRGEPQHDTTWTTESTRASYP